MKLKSKKLENVSFLEFIEDFAIFILVLSLLFIKLIVFIAFGHA